jgi:hypothetical protein
MMVVTVFVSFAHTSAGMGRGCGWLGIMTAKQSFWPNLADHLLLFCLLIYEAPEERGIMRENLLLSVSRTDDAFRVRSGDAGKDGLTA